MMPNTLQRYLFKQFFGASTYTTFLFVFVLIIGNALKEVLPLLASGKITWTFFFDLLFHLIPSMIAYALPLGLLTATLLVLGRLSAQNELMAMKASGLSLYAIVTPILLIAGLGTLFALIVNFYFGPNSITYYRASISNVIRQRPLQFIQAGTCIKDFPGYIFYVEKKHKDWVENCWLWELDGKSVTGINLLLHAEKGYIRYNQNADSLILTLIHGMGEKHTSQTTSIETQPITFENTSISLPLNPLLGSKTFTKRLGHMHLGELLCAKNTAKNLSHYTPQIAASLEIQKNAVMSFAVLSLIFIAIPLGIKVKRAETSANLVLAVGLALSYYFIVMAISWLETKPHLRPDLLVWIPNFIFQCLGVTLFIKISRH
ncbi:MAG: LptF/LptG family permease [Puniceicoccales bacterium]|jgi:lipopolysaccharide export system permease protein|nr:LptF/LptG family permease [Puniceicoccales bacterium]